MREVEIPGGIARFREGRAELRGRDEQLIKAAAMAAETTVSKLRLTEMPEGASEEETQRRIAATVSEVRLSIEDAQSLLMLRQAVVVATLHSWTLEDPLPTMETIGDLPADLYDALDEAIGGVPGAVQEAADFEPNPDPESPTPPSSDSAGLLRAGSKKSIRRPSTAGRSTPTESSTAA